MFQHTSAWKMKKHDAIPKWGKMDSGTYRENGQSADFIDARTKLSEKKNAINANQIGRWWPEFLSSGQLGTSMDGMSGVVPNIRRVILVVK